MGVKTYKPTTASRRNMSVSDFAEITKDRPQKSLLVPLRKTGGRNHHGKITARHRGGGSKRRYRLMDFHRDKDGMAARVLGIEYDPNRSARIALLEYEDGERRYILAPDGLSAGETVQSGPGSEPKVGNCLLLKDIPPGLAVHNVELIAGKGGQIVRSAGSSAQLSAREGKYVHLILPSGEVRRVPGMCRATVGRVSNVDHQNLSAGKAGRTRWRGRRPKVRGKAMNPVDHPMGGGEGRSNGGRHPCSPKGVLAKGGKTRSRHKSSDSLILNKRKKR